MIIDIVQYILIGCLGFILGYQMLLSIIALRGKEQTSFTATRRRKFAIVLPAHNEEKVISKSLYSLFGLVYPKSLYDVFVVADNCTDNTANIAHGLGATVLERSSETERGKGHALRWAFDQIIAKEEGYEGIIVFDADSLISGHYLEVMNYYLENGSKVVQSSDLVLPKPGVRTSETIRIGFLLYNYVKPMGRKVLGFNMGLRGNGMCFSVEVLKDNPWQAWSLTEDVEYGLILILEGIAIDFAPEAYVWALMPESSKNAESQRERWEFGRYPLIRRYVPKLIKAIFVNRSLKPLDTLVDLITPPLVNTLLVTLLMLLVNMAGWAIGWLPVHFVYIWAGIVTMGILHLFVGLYAAGADKQLYKSILYIPWYAFWKIKIYLQAVVSSKKNKQWIRTTRETHV
ncbi:glycosyltransferase family 2 protein [Fodinibius sp. AD559]|uniref:glycosyltransferase family 2 protein n=1 Tax=Fodinibius sp. AD559 TaxID=3424179 RepID=UPI004046F8D6